MLGSLLITLREGLEAALIIGIILAYLSRSGYRNGFKAVWAGTFLAVAVSLLVGAGIYVFVGELEGAGEQIFEGIALISAVGLLTWMIFWMRKQSVNLKTALQNQVHSALNKSSNLGLFGIAFLAVVREGIETVVFLFAARTGEQSPLLFTIGGIIGLVIAIAIGYLIYRGAAKLNLKTFFNVTGLLLIVFAAGMLAHGVHELNEVGYIPSLIEHVWDINAFLPETSTVGRFLGSLLGYNGNPSLTEMIAYIGYLSIVTITYFRGNLLRRTVQPAENIAGSRTV